MAPMSRHALFLAALCPAAAVQLPVAPRSAFNVAAPDAAAAAAVLKEKLAAPTFALTEEQIAVFPGPKVRPISALESPSLLAASHLLKHATRDGKSRLDNLAQPSTTMADRVAAIDAALAGSGLVDPMEARIASIEARLVKLGLMAPLPLEQKLAAIEATLDGAVMPAVPAVPASADGEPLEAGWYTTAPFEQPTAQAIAALIANAPKSQAEVAALIPSQPANFEGAQWAPTTFLPFEFEIANAAKPTAAATVAPPAPVPAPAPAPAAAPPAAPAAATTPGHFAVTLQTPDGDLNFEIPPDTYLLDHTDELDGDAYAELPYACRAGSCSACVGKVLSGKVDNSDGSFLSDEQKAEGYVLTCTTKLLSDAVIQTHQEDELH